MVKTLNDYIHDSLTIEDIMRRDEEADAKQVGGTHYKDMDPQPWTVMEALLTPTEFRGYLKGNMIKYAMRQGKKDSPDSGKYWHYKQKYDEFVRKQNGNMEEW